MYKFLSYTIQKKDMTFITFRRYYLDKFLSTVAFYGNVLDVGGKKENKRGTFRPPLASVQKWEYLNVDAATNPDYCCSAEAIPVANQTYDIVLITEVLEHLENPERVLAEVYRILKKHGIVIATMPFLYPIHGDPFDFQRWTRTKLKKELERAGLTIIQIEPMGSIFAVIYDLLWISLGMASKNPRSFKNRFVNKCCMPVIRKLFLVAEKRFLYKAKHITTGFFVQATKQ
jgi:SAM-dependent methyltransferase